MGKKYPSITANVVDTKRPLSPAPTGIPAGTRCARSPRASLRRCCPTTICTWPIRCGRRANCGAAS